MSFDKDAMNFVNPDNLPDPYTGIDELYRERAQLVALLSSQYRSKIVYNSDPSTDWPIVFVEAPTGQLSWYINPNDMDLFEHVVPTVYLNEGERVWDGHSTEEKYRRIRKLTELTSNLKKQT